MEGLFEKKDANVTQFSYPEQSMDFLQHKSKKRKGYLPEEEDSDRKQARNDEIQTRAARQLYVLRQQVREVQSQLIRGDADKLKHTKKVRPITLFEHRFGLMFSYWQIYRYIYPFHFKLEKEIELFPFSILWDDYFFVQYFSLKNICCQWNSKWMLISKFVRWMLIINYINGTHDILYQKWKKKFFKWVIHFFISKLSKALHYEYKKYMYFWIWTSKHC